MVIACILYFIFIASGKKITKKEFENALEIIERFKYQENPTKQVSIVYDSKIYVCVNVPIDGSVKKIKEELKDGSYHGLDLEEPVEQKIHNMSELIIDGEVIKLKN